MRLANLASGKEFAQVLGALELARMGPRLVNALVESDVGSFERIERHGAEDVGGVNQNFSRKQRENADRQHGLGTIDQRDGFLGFEGQGLDTRLLQSVGSGNASALFV